MAAKKNVSASVVREWAKANDLKVGARGRLNPDAVKAFHKANKGKVYVAASDAEKRTVTVKVQKVDSKGRKSMRPVTITTAEARKVLGHEPGKRGRISLEALSEALSKA